MTKKASDSVIAVLNEVLTAELSAINQYFIHAELCQHWGYERLYEQMRHQSIDEMKHAEALIERILYLDGLPNMQKLGKVSVGETVKEQFELDLQLEREAVERLIRSLRICDEHHDPGSRLLLERILQSEEEHVDWIDAQQKLLHQVGEQNYLAMQIKK